VKTKEIVFVMDKSSIKSKCEETECVESYGNDFILEQKKLRQSSLGCDDPSSYYKAFLDKEWQAYVQCRDSIFGVNHTLGINCESDSDCVDHKCNLITGFCLNDVKQQEQRFVECLVGHDQMDPYALGYLKLKYYIRSDNPTSDEFVSKLREGWSENDCVSKQELGLPYRNAYFWGPKYDFSPCQFSCSYFYELDPIPQFPFACAAPSGYCLFAMVHIFTLLL